MSYNRRGGPPLASVGQRRPQGGNFVSGGQLNRNAGFQQKHAPPPGNRPPQNQVNQQQQKQQSSPQVPQQPIITPPKPQQVQPQVQQQKPQVVPPVPVPQKPVQQNVVVPDVKPAPVVTSPQKTMQDAAQQQIAQLQAGQPLKVEPEAMEVAPTEANGDAKAKPFWMKKKTGKVSKAERVRRRNFRLKRVLQPKNALMVLNELIGSTSYTVSESKTGYNQDLFDATLSYDGEEFVGTGKSKVLAKTAAAEKAIKSIIVKKIAKKPQLMSPPTAMEEEDTTTEQEKQEEDLSWSHIASFAIHKLFTAWDEDGHLVENFPVDSGTVTALDCPLSRTSSFASLQTVEQKPAKKLPDNAAQLNPVMLLNQMYPNAKYEEVAKAGQPPNIQFTISCTVDGQVFTGIGQNKKTARKQAAVEVCRSLLKIEYPAESEPQNAATMETQ